MVRIHNTVDSENWWGAAAPTSAIIGATALWVGAEVSSLVDGRIMGARWYKPFGRAEGALAVITSPTGPKIAAKQFFRISNGADGWQQCWFRPVIPIVAGDLYRVWVLFPSGAYRRTVNAFSLGGVNHGNIRMSHGYQTTGLDVEFATVTATNNGNGVDILFRAGSHG